MKCIISTSIFRTELPCLPSLWTGCEMCPPCCVMPFGRCFPWVASSGCSGSESSSASSARSPTWCRRLTSSQRPFSVSWDSWTISSSSCSSLCTSPSCTERWSRRDWTAKCLIAGEALACSYQTQRWSGPAEAEDMPSINISGSLGSLGCYLFTGEGFRKDWALNVRSILNTSLMAHRSKQQYSIKMAVKECDVVSIYFWTRQGQSFESVQALEGRPSLSDEHYDQPQILSVTTDAKTAIWLMCISS